MKHFFWPVRIYYEDTDSGGVVYYANYLKFMERARTEWLRILGFEQDVLARDCNVLFVVRAVQIDYLQPARFNDLLQVMTKVIEVRQASLVFQHQVIDIKKDLLLCQGRIRIVCVHADILKPKQIPGKILAEVVVDQ
jgi:acyl-CoA thioester hydrolase